MSPDQNMAMQKGRRRNGKGESISKANYVLLYKQCIMSCGVEVLCRVKKPNIKQKEINPDSV